MEEFQTKNLIVLSGKAGCGKTGILYELEKQGEQVINLEELAQHRGSVFGALTNKHQPSHRSFVKNIIKQWQSFDSQKKIWIEDEAAFIGSVGLPVELFTRIKESPHITIVCPIPLRIDRIMAEYFNDVKDNFEAFFDKAKNRIGSRSVSQIQLLWNNKHYHEVIMQLLDYYDNAYENRIRGYARPCLATINTYQETIQDIAQHIKKVPLLSR